MSEPLPLANRVVAHMLERDAFSRWLGVELNEVQPGRVRITMRVREEMVNGFLVCHGGIPFAFADSAFAFAANSHGRISVAIENNISYPAAVKAGDVLTAQAEELHCGRRTGVYTVVVRNQSGKEVCFFRGTVFRTEDRFFPGEGA